MNNKPKNESGFTLDELEKKLKKYQELIDIKKTLKK